MIALSSEQGFPFWLAVGTVHRGLALAAQGQIEEGMEQMRQGMAALQAIGTEAGRPGQLVQLAWAYGQMGQAEEGLAVVAEALATVNKTGERISEAELYRRRGELTLKQFGVQSSEFGVTNPQPLTPNPHAETEAEACFHKAIEISRKQQAKSLELRATMNLARLWRQQGKQQQARKLLAEIYGWFTEGFDTKDLQEAKALLGELA
jgi:predicted ATPase